MDRWMIEEALRKNRKRQSDLDKEPLETLEDQETELRAEAENLRLRAAQKEREANKIEARIAKGDYGLSVDEKEELKALKDEERRLKDALDRTEGDKVSA